MDELSIRIAGIVPESIVDGPGFRYTVFTQGCPHRCEDCHNPETHTFDGGKLIPVSELLNGVLKNKLIRGITLTGGEPFCQANACAVLAESAKKNKLDIITYTGYNIECLINNANKDNNWMELLKNTDILIDGPYIKQQKSMMLKFRGSSNQRVIDCQRSLETGNVCILDW